MELQVGDKVLSADGNVYFVEKSYIEILKKPEKVYNFQIEDFHTYHVGKTGVLVHNADYESGSKTDAGEYAAWRSNFNWCV